MKAPLYALALVVGLVSAAPAIGHPLSCPLKAPAHWKLPGARLESVRVLSYPPAEPPKEGEALPMMAPFNEWQHGDTVYQSWNMNFDAPKFKFQVDCIYSGTERYLRLDASSVKLCVAIIVQQERKFTFHCK